MEKGKGRNERVSRRILTGVAAVAGVALIFTGGSLAYANYQGGRYVDVQDGFILKRLDAQDSYVVRLPSSAEVSGMSTRRVSSRPVTLTYDHSEKGKKNNWDIYTDEAGNRYTYHEETGRMMSIEFKRPSTASRTADAELPSEEEVHSFVEQYLDQLIPRFELYGLESEMKPNAPDDHYFLYYGVRVGEYCATDGITIELTAQGRINYLTLPHTTMYEELTTAEKERLAAKLPAREVLERYVWDQMEEKYGDRLVSVEISHAFLTKEDAGYHLNMSLGVKYGAISVYEEASYTVE